MASDTGVWQCPLNEHDADNGNTYWWHNGDSVTQVPKNYNPSPTGKHSKTRPLWVQDNRNGIPYISAKRRPKSTTLPGEAGDRTLDPFSGLYQGNNSGFMESQPWYFHRAKSSRWAAKEDSDVGGYGWGVNGVHLDLSAGFLAMSKTQFAVP
jgi:hypothetical protein